MENKGMTTNEMWSQRSSHQNVPSLALSQSSDPSLFHYSECSNYRRAHHVVVETVYSTTVLNIGNQPLHWSPMKSPGSTVNMTNDITTYKFSLECQSTLKHFHWVQDFHGMAKGPLVKCTEPRTKCLFQTANGWWWKCEPLLTNYIKRISRHHKNFKRG
jgi:hypothetical protein